MARAGMPVPIPPKRRTLPSRCRGSCRALPSRQSVTANEPYPAAKRIPQQPGPRQVHPRPGSSASDPRCRPTRQAARALVEGPGGSILGWMGSGDRLRGAGGGPVDVGLGLVPVVVADDLAERAAVHVTGLEVDAAPAA